MKRIRNYSAAKIDDNTKTSIAKLYIIQKDKGKTRQEFTAEMAQAGLSFSERQLDRWVSLINLGLEAISPQKLAGASAALTREQKDISSGWVLDRIDHGEAVHLETFCAFVLDHFSLKLIERLLRIIYMRMASRTASCRKSPRASWSTW
jgi:hypothetical protein